MKNPVCPCSKKKKRKTTPKSKRVAIATASYNKFAGVRAPILANTSGTFTMPGFAPIKAFPYPGLVVGNASQFDGLMPGSGRADMIAASIYRVQDKKDDTAAGLGVTGLNSAPKGNVSGNPSVQNSASRPSNLRFSFVDGGVKKEKPTVEEIEKAEQIGRASAVYNARNLGLGDSNVNPINIGVRPPSAREKTTSSVLGSPTPITQNQNLTNVRGRK